MPAPWTPPERRALRDLWRRGLPPSTIATSLRAQFGHRYRAPDIADRAREFGFFGEHPEAPAAEPVAAEPPAVVSAAPADATERTPRPVSWPEAAVDRLTQMWRDGATGPAIAAALTAEFGTVRSRNAVMGMVHRLGLKRQQPAEEVVEAEPAPAPAEPPPAAAPARVPLAVVRPEPRPADWPPAAGTPLADLRWGECRFPVSGFRALHHRFCAAPATGDSPYCAEHRAAALQAREPGRRPGRYPGWVADGGVA